MECFMDKYSTNSIREEALLHISSVNSRLHPVVFFCPDVRKFAIVNLINFPGICISSYVCHLRTTRYTFSKG